MSEFYSKKVIKIEVVGEKELSDVEQELFHAALFELKDKFKKLGVIFDQPLSNNGTILLTVNYPSTIKEKIRAYEKESGDCKRSLTKEDLEAIRKIIEHEFRESKEKDQYVKFGF